MVGAAFVLGGFVVGLRPFFDNSFFTHLATGRLILDQGIPRQDPYSFTAAGEPWVVQSWLVSVVLGLTERALGDIGVRLLAGLLLATLVALTWRLTRPARTLLPRIAIMGVVFVASTPFWTPRPLLVGLVLLAAALVIVQEDRDPRWLIPIMWVWANSHGSFPLGLVAIASIAAGRFLDGERSRAIWRPLGWALLGTLLAVIGPMGPALLTFPITLLGKMEILQRVIEWQSPNFSTGFARVFLLQIVIAVLALVRRPSYRLAVPLVVFTAAALLGQRNIPNATLVLVPGLAVGLAGLGSIEGRERGLLPASLAVAVLLMTGVVGSNVLAQPAFDLSSYPTDAITWMDQRGLVNPTSRIATQDTVGNTLELLYGTRTRTFFDDRYDMYPLPVARDYLAIHAGQPGWEAALDRHGVQYVLWSRSDPLLPLVAASENWRVLYQDPKAFVACRRGSGAPDC